MFCGKCGNQIMDDEAFCAKCGTPVEGAQVQAVSGGVQTAVSDNNALIKGTALIMGFFCAIAPFLKSLEIPAVSWIMGLAGLSSDGSFSFYNMLQLFWGVYDGNVGDMVESALEDDGGMITLPILVALIILAILMIASYVASLTLLLKNDPESDKKGWGKLRATAVGSLGFNFIMLILYIVMGAQELSDASEISLSDVISIKGLFYVELIIAVAVMVISSKCSNRAAS